MTLSRTVVQAAAGVAFLLSGASAFAADAVETPQEVAIPGREWKFAIAPYIWGAGLQGDVGVFGRQPVEIDMSFGDILSDLRFAGMVVAEAHNGSWGVFGDLIYVNTKADGSITRTIAGIPVELASTVATESLTATLLGEYRAYADDRVTVDLMAGARLWSVDNEITASLGRGGIPLRDFSGADGATWVDPMIGVKARFDTGTPWYFTGWAMVGGFGAGSDVTWDAMAGAGYQWNDWLSTVGGYRALGVDYSDDGFVYDVVEHGLFFGAVMTF